MVGNLLDAKITTIEKIAHMQKCSKQKVYDFLCFAKIPNSVWNAVIDMSKVSSRSAKTIYALCNKGDQYIDAIIDIAEEIRKGAGAKKIEALVMQIISQDEIDDEAADLDSKKTILDSKGNVIGYWKKDGITFSNSVNIDQKKIEDAIVSAIEE